MGLAAKMRADARLAILELLAEDPGYSLNHVILRDAVDRLTAITLSEAEIKAHIAWLEDRGLVTAEEAPPYVLARLTDAGLEVARGHRTVEGVSRRRPDAPR